MSVLFGAIVLVAALVVGELLFRWRSEPARLWGNVSQMLYALGGIVIFGIIILGLDGVGLYIAAVLVVLYYWLFRVRQRDVAETNWRRAVGGK
jgi:hypothetical protein